MKSKSTFSILFFLRQERENKNGAPLMLRVTINGKSAKTSLGIRVPSNGERGSVLNIVFSTQNAANRRKTGKMSGIVYERERI